MSLTGSAGTSNGTRPTVAAAALSTLCRSSAACVFTECQKAGASVLKRWVRATGPSGKPLDLLLQRDFGAFEDALQTLAERGFVLRSG